jgi:hypothetical protein
VFIDVLCEDKYELLGDAPTDVLMANFEAHVEAYNDKIGGLDMKASINKLKKIILLESKTIRARCAMALLICDPSEENFNALISFGYSVPNYKYKNENVQLLLDSFEGFVKFDCFELDKMVKDYTENNKDEAKGKPTHEGFMDMIVALMTHFKISINENEISVEKYCSLVRSYQKEIDRMIASQNKMNVK